MIINQKNMKTALISVFDKTDIITFVKFLLENDYQILSSGGTYNKLVSEINSENIHDISSYTLSEEILNGRVKTLHPKIYGGILAKRDDNNHINELKRLDINLIDIVVVNLYPFSDVVSNKNVTKEIATEYIDIGGHTLIRAAAKNCKDVLVITDIIDYDFIINNFDKIDEQIRMKYASKAFSYITEYDMHINNYYINLSGSYDQNTVMKIYKKEQTLKYGCNPQQKNAGLYKNILQNDFPFKILNGNIGYINVLDAIYAWNLVYELKNILGLPSAASFKHNSPAGSAVYCPLDDITKKAYNIENKELSRTSIALIRARNADPMCSYGDFIAISEKIDEETAKIISMEVSDGIIAFDYSDEALNILCKKKNGNYVILKASNHNINDDIELRELHGVTLVQEKNKNITSYDKLNNIVTNNKELSDSATRDIIVANTTLKYTQSNSVAFAIDGQCIGIGAGQQSRIDCVKLAKQKATTWFLRKHPKCLKLFDSFKNGIKKQSKVNAIVKYIDGDFTDIEFKKWKELFVNNIDMLSNDDRLEFIKILDNVSIASDAFFPFRDNIDTCAKIGVKYIVQPGGSIADNEVIDASNEYGMTMIFTGPDMRMFLH
jgi:phosphoribosylaminoimidazolecarboxamide formyltransferase/IMP cyclohydrolase